MPSAVKLVLYAIAALFAALSLFFAWHVVFAQASHGALLLSVVLAVAGIGLLRRLAWARFLASCFSVLSSFIIAARFIPDIEDRYGGGPLLEQLFGSMPPLWVAWLLVVAVTALPLLPVLGIGWRKSWFRNALW